ncbi:DUF6928 family protein [Kitasatospora cineracea]
MHRAVRSSPQLIPYHWTEPNRRLVTERPSVLPAGLVAASAGRRLVLHATDSVVAWSAFGS